MKEQTAVQWLVNYMETNFNLTDESLEAFEQAKEMEKQQIIDAHIDGFYSEPFGKSRKGEAEKYYSETFNK